tara:strand:- start:1378 stop:2097 length:720 start_codon:yes stop_codon:yes gene_type:complete
VKRRKKDGWNPIPHIESSAARWAQSIGAIRTGVRLPLDKVPSDPATEEAYSRGLERGWKAYTTWKAGSGMAVEAWIDAAIFGQDSADCFDTPLTMSKGIVFDYLRAARSSTEVYEQRTLFEELGHDPVDFDTISQAGAIAVTDHGPDGTEADDDGAGDELDEDHHPAVDDVVAGRLFFTDDLDEVEKWVWWLKYAGFPNAEVVDRLPAGMLGDVADPENKVSKVYRRAKDKASRFWSAP